jgi:hypothetical protein
VEIIIVRRVNYNSNNQNRVKRVEYLSKNLNRTCTIAVFELKLDLEKGLCELVLNVCSKLNSSQV